MINFMSYLQNLVKEVIRLLALKDNFKKMNFKMDLLLGNIVLSNKNWGRILNLDLVER